MRRELLTYQDPKSPVSEVFRTLRTNIQFMNTNRKLKTLLVTSTFPEEGKSWVTANLAVTFAQAGKRVILVDADMRKGRQYNIFGVLPKPGLSNYLSNMDAENNEINDVNITNYIQETDVSNLHVLTAGNVPPNPSELLVSHRMRNLLQDLKNMCDLVIIDGTPCDLVTDALILSRIVDSTIVVAAQKQTKKDALVRVVKNIQNVGGRIAGVVLNKVDISTRKYNQAYYYGSIGGSNLPAKTKRNKKDIEKMDGFVTKLFRNSSKDIEFEVPSYEAVENKEIEVKDETDYSENVDTKIEESLPKEEEKINYEYNSSESVSTGNSETINEVAQEYNIEQPKQEYEPYNAEQVQHNYEQYNKEPIQPSYETYNVEQVQQNYEQNNKEPIQPNYETYNVEQVQKNYEQNNKELIQPSYETYNVEQVQKNYEQYNKEPIQQNYEPYNAEQVQHNYEQYNKEPIQPNYGTYNAEKVQHNYEQYNKEPIQQSYGTYNVEQVQQNYEPYNNNKTRHNYELYNMEEQQENYDIVPNIKEQLENSNYDRIEQQEKEEYRKIKEQINNNNKNFRKNKKKNKNKKHYNEYRHNNYNNESTQVNNNKSYKEIEARVQGEGKISEVKIEQSMDEKTKEILRQVNAYIEAEKNKQGE